MLSSIAGRLDFLRMMEIGAEQVRQAVDSIYREDSRQILATLIRLLGDFDLAEDALHDAFRAALEQWPKEGLPGNPRAWLISTGRFKALDAMRRRVRFNASQEAITDQLYAETAAALDDAEMEEDQLRLLCRKTSSSASARGHSQ